MSETENEIVEIANEFRRLQRQLDSKTQQLESLLAVNSAAGDFPVTDFGGAANKRYSIDFVFKPGVLVPQERSVTIDSGTIFRCAYMESFLRAIGTSEDPFTGDPTTVQVTLPWNDRLVAFDYFFRVRDTGTDREWFDQPQPSLFGGGGYLGPLWFPRRNILGGGNVLYATIDPFLSVSNGNVTNFFLGGTIEQYVVQLSFVGHEMPDSSEL